MSQLEKTLQRQNLVITKLTQSQNQRLNELADEIHASVQEKFANERENLQNISKDVYIEESYNIMLDLIDLQNE